MNKAGGDFFNKNLDSLANSLISKLVNSGPIEVRKNKKSRPRKSKLSNSLLENIINKRSQGWSYQRIADSCKKFPECEKLNKSTVYRFLNK